MGATGAAYELGATARVLIACRALCFYAGKVALPASLGHVPETDADAFPQIGTVPPGREELKIKIECGVPLPRLRVPPRPAHPRRGPPRPRATPCRWRARPRFRG